MIVNEVGKGRRLRCPICNTLFTIDREDIKSRERDFNVEWAKVCCPICDEELQLSLVVQPKADVFVNGINAKNSGRDKYE